MWQVEMEAWRTLGYRSWSAMREAEYGGAAFMVPARQRPELVARMRVAGLTQREVADTAGVSTDTVQRDLNTADAALSDTTITNARGQQRPATYTPDKESGADRHGVGHVPASTAAQAGHSAERTRIAAFGSLCSTAMASRRGWR